jgi:hypothetical protein
MLDWKISAIVILRQGSDGEYEVEVANRLDKPVMSVGLRVNCVR